MKAFDNSGLLDMCANCDCSGFAPSLAYAYDANADTMTITDASVFPAGDGLSIIHVYVTDKHGNQAIGKIEAAAGNVAVDTSNLNAAGGFNVRATIVTDNKCKADLAVYDIASATANAGALTGENKSL